MEFFRSIPFLYICIQDKCTESYPKYCCIRISEFGKQLTVSLWMRTNQVRHSTDLFYFCPSPVAGKVKSTLVEMWIRSFLCHGGFRQLAALVMTHPPACSVWTRFAEHEMVPIRNSISLCHKELPCSRSGHHGGADVLRRGQGPVVLDAGSEPSCVT